MGVAWSSALLDREYDGAWNKLVLLRALMRAALGGNHTGGEPGGGGGGGGGGVERTRWLLWADWDVLFTDLSFELPVDDYEARGLKLVLGGELKDVYEEAVYLKLNSGLMLLRGCGWSLSLLDKMLQRGQPQPLP